ncbi:hypothetical protein KTN05_13515 [Paracoccus sp. Z118]|uniref:hypothetical protein n=1 Tax=Paracoccus sp. Z118 TaxID=2851017 RepID=UPI001C2BC25D|nr:hypothetical protein [Paracoccus sp. Z118]MBV0892860.1 hypothetical protein [Paracoccus sp. Z118]
MEPAQLVAEELKRGTLGERELTADLQQALERHCSNLVTLVQSLHASGRDRDAIRELVAVMLRSYEDDLIQVLGKDE